MAVYTLPQKKLNDPFSRLFQVFGNRSATENSFPDFMVSGTFVPWLEFRIVGMKEELLLSYEPLSITILESETRRGDVPSQDKIIDRLANIARSGDEKSFVKVASEIDWSQRSDDDFLSAIRMALQVGAHLKARKLALQGAEQYPEHSELLNFARILAPPKVTISNEPPDPTLRLNRDWLRDHSDEYHGRWVALKAGQLLAVGDSPKELNERLGDTKKVLLTKVY